MCHIQLCQQRRRSSNASTLILLADAAKGRFEPTPPQFFSAANVGLRCAGGICDLVHVAHVGSTTTAQNLNMGTRRLSDIETSIERYLSKLDAADRNEPALPLGKIAHLHERIIKLKEQLEELKAIEIKVQNAPDAQVSLTDPDARSMRHRGGGIVGYNVQTAVDVEHHLIVAHEVTSSGSDRGQLVKMANQARLAIGGAEITVVADRGYYGGEQLLECANTGITTYVPKPLTSSGLKRGFFIKQDFIYDAQNDIYICPAGQSLTKGAHARQPWG
jgi:hypothetical protein